MHERISVRIEDHFADLTDPRRSKVTYPLMNVVTIALCAVICGADDFVAITVWAKAKKKWLSRFPDLGGDPDNDGIPSHDRFHVVKLMNEKLTTLRRELYREATAQQKQVLKGSRWLLLKHPDNLDASRDEAGRLHAALRLNESLATAYYLKEALRQIWE